MLKQIDAAVVEGIGQAMTRPIDCEDAVVLGERLEDRDDFEGAGEPAVDVQQWRAGAELEELRLAQRPADSADSCVWREPGEQRGLCLRELPIQVHLH